MLQLLSQTQWYKNEIAILKSEIEEMEREQNIAGEDYWLSAIAAKRSLIEEYKQMMKEC